MNNQNFKLFYLITPMTMVALMAALLFLSLTSCYVPQAIIITHMATISGTLMLGFTIHGMIMNGLTTFMSKFTTDLISLTLFPCVTTEKGSGLRRGLRELRPICGVEPTMK